jgi:hypothetical protein
VELFRTARARAASRGESLKTLIGRAVALEGGGRGLGQAGANDAAIVGNPMTRVDVHGHCVGGRVTESTKAHFASALGHESVKARSDQMKRVPPLTPPLTRS